MVYITWVITVVAGANGMLGREVLRSSKNRGFETFSAVRSSVDLTKFEETLEFLKSINPDLIINCAGLVGGIAANAKQPVEFLNDNMSIQFNLLNAAHALKVKRFINIASSCIYPKVTKQPMHPSSLMGGELEPTNKAFAMAKLSAIELVKSYRTEFGHEWVSIIPSNLFGNHDNYNLADAHLMPALIRRFHEANLANIEEVNLWGTGTPKREFLHVSDLADAIFLISEKYNHAEPINVGSGEEIETRELANILKKISSYQGRVSWDHSKPDGTMQKLLDSSEIRKLGWEPKISLEAGVADAYDWFARSYMREGTRL